MMQWMEHQAIMLQFLAVHQSALVPVTYFITHYNYRNQAFLQICSASNFPALYSLFPAKQDMAKPVAANEKSTRN